MTDASDLYKEKILSKMMEDTISMKAGVRWQKAKKYSLITE